MSDIHGRYDEYLEMLLKINFSHKDKLYILGDVIDRGQNPIKVLRHTMYADNIVLLMGNHEKMMLDSASVDE
jgi:serine/threonine protein phosphatase 1